MKAGRAAASRLFVDAPLTGDRAPLSEREAHYLSHVLRLRVGTSVVVFNGRGGERLATIASLSRQRAEITLGEVLQPIPEPTTPITLLQGLVKFDAMDLVVQKAAELGVVRIVAVKSEYSVIKLDDERRERRLAHWTRVAQSACEQSKRHYLPEIDVEPTLARGLGTLPADCLRIAMHPDSAARLDSLKPRGGGVCVAVGPEGGFGARDLSELREAGFVTVGLGPRTLRAETAAIAACSLAQLLWGDLGIASGTGPV